MAGGISRFDLSVAATTPKMKKSMAGSSNGCIQNSFRSILKSWHDFVKSILKSLTIGKNLCISPSDK
jgi:hypothetical protein